MSETQRLFQSNSCKKDYNSINNTSKASNFVMTTAKEVKHNEYHFHWRLHFFWTLAVICFIIGKLWWLVPLPGAQVLPPYRTYPANFLDTLFITIGCALAARSVVIGLVKSFSEGIYPDSIVTFGQTGGFGAMWSCIRHRSGVRYFLIATLVTACTLVGNALQGELQSSVRIYYKGDPTSAAALVECSHASPKDFTLASSAYSSGLISNTLSDAASLLDSLNRPSYQPIKSFSVSLIKSTLTPIQNVTFLPAQSNTRILRRHHPRPTSTLSSTTQTQQKEENTQNLCYNENQNNSTESDSSSGDTNNDESINEENEETTTNNEEINLNSGVTHDSCTDSSTTLNNNNAGVINKGNNNGNKEDEMNNNENNSMNANYTIAGTLSPPVINNNDSNNSLIISSAATAAYAESSLGFNSSKLTIIRSSQDNNRTALPLLLGQTYNSTTEIPIKLNVFRYTTPDNKNAVIIHSLPTDGYHSGVYVNAEATNYTCQQSRGGNVMCGEGKTYTANSQVIADAMVAAIQSGEGLYGTNSVNGLTLDIVNGVNSTGTNSKLVDALFTNPYCNSNSALTALDGSDLFPYSAGEITPLAILWLALFFILWLIGVYLIGYSEHTWTELASSGSLVAQIISKSPNMFENNELGARPVNQEMFLDPEEGKMNFDKNYRHGYTVTTAEMET